MVEHIVDTNWIEHVFRLEPKLLVVTTPSQEFNALYDRARLQPNGLRHPDRNLEFTRAEFMAWARKLGDTFNYEVDLLPIGPADVEHDGSGLLAIF